MALAFVQGTESLATMTILAAIIEPQQKLMSNLLEMSGSQWDVAEDSKVAFAESLGAHYDRQVRAIIAYNGTLEKAFLGEMEKLLSGRKLHNCLPASQHTIQVCSLGFRMVSAAAGLCHELLLAPHSRYPWKLFGLAASMGPEAFAEHVAHEPSCMLDEWSRAFVSFYEGRLDSAEAVADLFSTGLMVALDTAQIEARHSGIRRRILKSSLQTHAQTVQAASAEFVFARMAALRRETERLAGASPTPSGNAKVGARNPAAANKRRGGGGPWRAFVHMQYAGKGKADLKKASAEYKALDAHQAEELVALGKLGTQAHRAGHQSFGPTSRELTRLRRKRLRSELEDEAGIAAKAALARQCGEAGAPDSERALALAQATTGDQLVPRAMPPWETYMITTQALAARMDLLRRSMCSEMASSLSAWAQQQVATTDTGLASGLPSDVSAAMTIAPSGLAPVRRWHWRNPSTMDIAARAVSTRGELAVGKALKGALRDDWDRKHRTIAHDSRPRLGTVKQKTTLCCEAGVCLCSTEGRALRFLSQRLAEVVRAVCPQDSEMRADLGKGKLGYLLTGTHVGEGDGRENDAALADSALACAGAVQVFLHVSAHYMSPFRPTFQVMHLLKLQGRRARCKAVPVWQTQWEALGNLDRNQKWALRLFRLCEIGPPLATFTLETQEYNEVVGECPEWVFWHGPDDSARSRRIRFGGLGDSKADKGDDEAGNESEEDAGDAPGDAGREELSDEDGDAIDLWLNSDDGGDGDPLPSEGTEEPESPAHAGQQQVAASSDEPPPPLVGEDMPDRHQAAQRGSRRDAEVYFMVPGGDIRYYSKLNRFSAVCEHADHTGRCRREKVAHGSNASAGQGRPLGYLMAWLAAGEKHASRREHMAFETTISFEERAAGRAALRQISGAEQLFAAERPRRPNEGEEPESHP